MLTKKWCAVRTLGLSSIIDDIGHSASNAINNGIKGVKDYFKNGGTVGVSNDNTGYSITTNGMTSGGNSIDASMHVGGANTINAEMVEALNDWGFLWASGLGSAYSDSNEGLLAMTVSYSTGGGYALGKGYAGQVGIYITSGGNSGNADAGSFVTYSKTYGFGAGGGSGIDIWRGGHDVFDGDSETLSLGALGYSLQLHTIKNPGVLSFKNIIGIGISKGSEGGASSPLAGTSFIGSKDHTIPFSIRRR